VTDTINQTGVAIVRSTDGGLAVAVVVAAAANHDDDEW